MHHMRIQIFRFLPTAVLNLVSSRGYLQETRRKDKTTWFQISCNQGTMIPYFNLMLTADTSTFLEDVADPLIGFTIAAVIGYYLYKMMATKARRNMLNTNDENSPTNDEQIITDEYDNYKLVLVIRTDLKMGKGKVAAQCAHAAVAAYKAATYHPATLKAWEDCGQAKITVKVDNETALKEVAKHAKNIGLLASIIQDAGHTQVPSGSRTVCAVGPGPARLIDQVTGHLRLF